MNSSRLLLSSFFSQTEKFSGAVDHQDSISPVSMAAEAEPGHGEHENMKNLLISSDSLSADPRSLRRSRAVRSKTRSLHHDSHQLTMFTSFAPQFGRRHLG